MGELAVADVEAESGIKINHLVSADCGYTLLYLIMRPGHCDDCDQKYLGYNCKLIRVCM